MWKCCSFHFRSLLVFFKIIPHVHVSTEQQTMNTNNGEDVNIGLPGGKVGRVSLVIVNYKTTKSNVA